MSIKKDLFIALSDYLMAKLQFNDGIPSVQWVDKDLGQAELIQDNIISLPMPAVLISFPTAEYGSTLGSDQTGEAMLRIRTLFENYFDASVGSPNRDMAIQFFEFNERVHTHVNRFVMERIGGIQRIGETEDDDHNNVIVTDVMYKFTLYDRTNDPFTYTSGNVAPRFKKQADEDYTIPTGYVIPKQ